jgi:hypothetical protein
MPRAYRLVIERCVIAPMDQKGAAVMSAQTPYLQVDALGVFPTLLLLLVLLLAALGIVAHAASI